jgi:hypothetical protein
MAAFNKFNAFVNDIATKVHNLHSDTLKVMLSNVAPSAANAVKADITEIAAGNGYSAGGTQATLASDGQSGGVYKLVLNPVTWTASGGAIATFRYAVLYNDTPTSPLKPLIGWYDYGAAVNVTSGNSFTVDFDLTAGALTLQ